MSFFALYVFMLLQYKKERVQKTPPFGTFFTLLGVVRLCCLSCPCWVVSADLAELLAAAE
jgi:hypothetical protein